MTALPPRVVLDTNVLIRAFLGPNGPSGTWVELARTNKLILCFSDEALAELEEVIARPFIYKALGIDSVEQHNYFLDQIANIANLTVPTHTGFELLRDPDDEFVIDLAVSSEANYLITYDRDLLDLMTGSDIQSKQFRQEFRSLKIVRPEEFLRIVAESSLSLEP